MFYIYIYLIVCFYGELFRVYGLKQFRKSVAVRICPRFWLRGESISINAFRWFESGYRFEKPKMHLQNFENFQSRKKRRNLSKSPFFLRFCAVFVPASKSDTHHGWDGRIRTDECGSQSPVPYRLATSH